MRLVVESLALSRGGRPLFRDLSFTIEEGQALLVTGANGAGKSSLLRAVAGFLPHDAGRIAVENAGDVGRAGETAQYLGHRDGLRGALTARENLAFAATLATPLATPAATTMDALAAVGLPRTADRPVGLLSAGQRRRVALARLLVCARPLWLLDEPTSALDAQAQAMVSGLLRRHLDAGGLALIATHLPLDLDAREIAREIRLGGGG